MTWYRSLFNLLIAAIKYFFNRIKLLLSTRNIPTQIFGGNLAALNPQYANDEERLAGILQEFESRTVSFVSVNVNSWDQDQSKITDIGICTWYASSSEYATTYSYHWKIKENMFLKNIYVPCEPDIFAFGNTKVINELQIAQTFDNLLEPLITEFPKVIIVGHDIHSIIHLLRNRWKPPESILSLDTQKLWQIKNHQLDQVDLKRALETTPTANYEKRLLHNAGNDARYTLELI